MDDLTKAYAWREALELSRQLAAMCEEFSDAATNVLVWHVRQAVVDVPAGIATNLQDGESADMEAVVKLMTVLCLINKIYPAIETGEADERLQRLVLRMKSAERFGEREPEPEADADSEAAAGSEATHDEAGAGDEAAGDAAQDSEAAAAETVAPPAPTNVPVMPQVDGVGRQSPKEQ